MAAYLTDQQLVDNHLPGDVATQSTVTDRAAWLAAASAQADGYLRRAGYTLPLASAGDDLQAAVGAIATYHLASKLGLLPEPAAQSAIYLRHKAALEWLRGVADGSITPIVVGGDPDDDTSAAPLVDTEPRRGW